MAWLGNGTQLEARFPDIPSGPFPSHPAPSGTPPGEKPRVLGVGSPSVCVWRFVETRPIVPIIGRTDLKCLSFKVSRPGRLHPR